MLQQTGVARAMEKYDAFLESFPSFERLARAPMRDVLRHWKGLGYNRRAFYLHRTAAIINSEHGGSIPRSVEELERFPGIGRATASAVLVFSYDMPIAFIETNIRRVFLHYYFPEQERVHDSQLLPFVEETMDRRSPREWFYALMDHGASLRKALPNPNLRSAHYHRQSAFEGSVRQARGMVLAALLSKPLATRGEIRVSANKSDAKVSRELLDRALVELVAEGFVKSQGSRYSIS